MGAGMDTSELYRIAMSYKAKLGPFATPRILNEYLKAVFRAPDLSSSVRHPPALPPSLPPSLFPSFFLCQLFSSSLATPSLPPSPRPFQFVEAMDLVVNQLLKVKDQELVDAIAEIAREVVREEGRGGKHEEKEEDEVGDRGGA